MKQKRKENTNMIVFTFALGLIVVGSVIYQHISSPEEIAVNDFSEVSTISATDPFISESDELETGSWNGEVNTIENSDSNEKISPSIIEQEKSFSEAFAEARSSLGSGKTFSWNGSEYSTLYAEEKTDDTSILAENETKSNDVKDHYSVATDDN
tara:strand:- start:78 stop:539 length:462 start_codon:yes stop_codon:yes gene_type:complete